MRGSIVRALAAWVWLACAAHAFELDAEHIQITGKVFTQASLRMEDSDSGGRDCSFSMTPGTRCTGFTFPSTEAGQLIQHRNLLDVEWRQDVAGWLGSERVWLDDLSYRLRVKYFYEGLYDYGPRAYRDPSSHLQPDGQPDVSGQEGLRANRHLDMQHDPIWNAYIDAGKGPLWMRVGRQDLSWGETDGFRLLDMIEPLDNRFGFPLVEDLDDRRIPLWMLRPTLRLPSIGALTNLTLDGYWVPGSIDDQESPLAPVGNPFGGPAPPGSAVISIPHKNIGNSRGGGRLLGTLSGVTFSLGHYVTFNDAPSVRQSLRALAPALDAPLLAEYYQQQVTGGSATFALPFDPYSVVRFEIAHFWDERVFIPDESANLAALLAEFTANGGQPVAGALPKRNTLRWMIGLDRNVWLRWLNPQNSFLVSLQYFQTDIFSYDPSISYPAVSSIEFPATPGLPIAHAVPRKNDEIILTYLVSTLYHHGTIIPQLFGGYETRGVNVIVPALTYQLGTNVQLTLKYAIIFGTYADLGFFRDRDQLLFRVQYNLS
jgi:Protein of unknown function (DUF1302)